MKISNRVLHLIVMGKPEDPSSPKALNLFEKLHTKEGIKNAKYWFKKQAIKNVRVRLFSGAPSPGDWRSPRPASSSVQRALFSSRASDSLRIL